MRRICILILAGLMAAPIYAISTCTDIIEQMHLHTHQHSNAAAKKYPWADFSWITTVLGDALVTPISEDRYTWGTYSLIVRNGQVYDEAGVKPSSLKTKFTFAPPLEEAIAALGKPRVHTLRNLNEYRWACTDTSSTLDVIADGDNKIVSSSFFYCKTLRESGCSYGHLG